MANDLNNVAVLSPLWVSADADHHQRLAPASTDLDVSQHGVPIRTQRRGRGRVMPRQRQKNYRYEVTDVWGGMVGKVKVGDIVWDVYRGKRYGWNIAHKTEEGGWDVEWGGFSGVLLGKGNRNEYAFRTEVASGAHIDGRASDAD